MTLPTLYSLTEAAAKLGPSITAAMLSTEITRGRLACVRIAGKRRLTEAQIKEWLECQDQPSQPGSSSAKGTPQADTPATHGSSLTEDARSARAAALKTATELRKRSRTISQPSTNRPAGNVTSLASRSAT